MPSIDQRPVHIKALHWLGIMAVCSPVGVGAIYGIDRAASVQTPGSISSTVIVLALFVAAAALVAALIAQLANPRFDLQRPSFPEFLKGLALVPAYLLSYGALIVIPVLFLGGVLGVALWMARRL